MDGGKILVEGPPGELLRNNVGGQVVEAQVPPADRARFLDKLRDRGVDFQDRGDSVLLYGGDGVASLDGDLDGYPVVRRPANLEDVFLRLTGRG
jgi:lipooligosaccharide transport system ATP-binding protein